ncbi:MAG: hypothetical protein K8W52_00720 [Deltaproteobacteria bacterium]|nr:hypothetical protein [Deltaproteobacteria bacterium]
MNLRRAVLALGLVALAACGPDTSTFSIKLTLTQGDAYRCPSPNCAGIMVSCDTVVSVRIVDASDPSIVYLSRCLPLPTSSNLCSLASLDLTGDPGAPTPTVPNRMVRVEVLVWPAVALDDGTCPTNIEFDARGMPVAVSPAPAIGGQTYFLPGSSSVAEVELGCQDAGALNELACRSAGTTRVRAVVDDFDTRVFLPPMVARDIEVSAGVPVARTNPDTGLTEWLLDTTDGAMPNIVPAPVPAWQHDTKLEFDQVACVEVLDSGTEQTHDVTCRQIPVGADGFDVRAFRLAKSSLNQVVGVLRLPGAPDDGLVVGIVVDYLGAPVAGATVLPSKGSVRYVNADRTMLTEDTVTSPSGMFVSQDVPFDAAWTATDAKGLAPSEPPVGGLLVGAATIVVIQLQPPPVTP